ncbi:S8 family serine peptidase [Paenibacillus algicola]|uniref:S8 family serine peptidase n=1 Tax=Paenibacillus algicola TaxID=2565926 RepID=UPI00389916D1
MPFLNSLTTDILICVLKKAIDSGIIIITSAGNDMTKQDLYPSVYLGVITVTSLDKENNHLYTNNFNDHLTVLLE